jgi:hypothetical protein
MVVIFSLPSPYYQCSIGYKSSIFTGISSLSGSFTSVGGMDEKGITTKRRGRSRWEAGRLVRAQREP